MPRPFRHFLLTAFGSSGDILPLASIGTCLAARGHRVTFVGGGTHANLIRACGMHLVPVADPRAHEASLRDIPLLGTRYQALFLQRHALAWNAGLWREIRRVQAPGLILVSMQRNFLWADLVAHAHLGISAIRLFVDLPPMPGQRRMADGLPPGRVQAQLTARIQQAWQAVLAGTRCHAGRTQIRRAIRRAQSSVPRLALWPEWLTGAAGRGWCAASFGFLAPPRAPAAKPTVSPLEKRSGHIVFLAGSKGTTRDWSDRFREAARSACRNLGLPGLLLGEKPAVVSPSEHFRCEEFVPLDHALEDAAAVVHHGGIGTAATALRLGLPQLMLPRMFCQPGNAAWFQRLGVARTLDPALCRPEILTSRLRELIADPGIRQRARELGVRIQPEMDLLRVCDCLEDWKGAPGQARNPRGRFGSTSLAVA